MMMPFFKKEYSAFANLFNARKTEMGKLLC